MSKKKAGLLIIAAFIIGLSLSSLASYAVLAHGGDLNLIHACVKNSNGNIRIVGANDNCNGNETALDWHKNNLPPFECTNACNLDGNLTPLGNRFKNKDFTESIFINANINNIDFTGSTFVNALIYGSTIYGSIFTNVNFTNANLSNTDFSSELNTLTGAIWNNTICPDGTNSNNNGNTCNGHLSP